MTDIRYVHSTAVHNTNSAKELVPLFINWLKPSSVVDVGCGIGTWLSVFQDFGVKDIVGIDGEYVSKRLLFFDENKFISHDLTKPLNLGRKFDLVVSLEVAEHLPESSADMFIELLTSLGDVVIFSAAIPNQGGQNHLNEQWPTYWQGKFNQHRFNLYDCIRPIIWLNESIDCWYRQNMLLAVREGVQVPIPKTHSISHIVHPELYNWRVKQLDLFNPNLRNEDFQEITLKVAVNIFLRVLKRQTIALMKSAKKIYS